MSKDTSYYIPPVIVTGKISERFRGKDDRYYIYYKGELKYFDGKEIQFRCNTIHDIVNTISESNFEELYIHVNNGE